MCEDWRYLKNIAVHSDQLMGIVSHPFQVVPEIILEFLQHLGQVLLLVQVLQRRWQRNNMIDIDLHYHHHRMKKMKNSKHVSRAASTTRNLSIAMHMTSAATSAAGSAVRAYGASYFKGNHENEKSNRSPGSSSLQMSLSSHPLLEELTEMILTSSNINSKNVDMLVAVERVCVMLGGCRVTFCKSGKDRTGMAVTYEQSRQLGERFGCGQSTQRILKDANIMRYTFFFVSSYLI